MKRKESMIKICGCGCVLVSVGILSVAGYCEQGVLPIWLTAIWMVILMAVATVLYQLASKLAHDSHRRRLMAERIQRIEEHHRAVMEVLHGDL